MSQKKPQKPQQNNHATPQNNNVEQQQLHQALNEQQRQIKQFDKVLWWVLPILAFFLAGILANYNIASTILSFIVLAAAFIAVGIKKYNLPFVLVLALFYFLADNYFSYGQQINITGLKRQLVMLAFIAFIGVGRIFAERAMIKPNQKF